MFSNRRNWRAAGIVAALGLSAGCLERKETITVAGDGSVTIRLEFKGSEEEMKTLDALPSSAGGWTVTRRTEEEGGKEKEVLTAERNFPPGSELPRRWTDASDPFADLCLSFPTSVTTERREDGVYYHFRRAYAPRRWAFIHYWEEKFLDRGKQDWVDKPAEELTPDQRVELLKAFTGIESFRQIELARAALDSYDSRLTPDRWLRMRQAVLDVYAEVDFEELAKLPEDPADEDRDAKLERLAKQLVERAARALGAALEKDASGGEAQVARFREAFERAKREYEITTQLGAHAFAVRVLLPGRVIAHNGDKLDDDGAVEWEFLGDAFRDRTHELMASSRVQIERGIDTWTPPER